MGTHPESLPRARVIRRRSLFTATRERGRRTTNSWMTLSALARDPATPPDSGDVAFLTPKRIGNAAVRNRLRRRMREIYRRTPGLFTNDALLVWIARSPAVELPFAELKECMLALLRRGGRLS